MLCALQDAYDLNVLPAIIIVDPNTGQKMHERTGNVTVERFLEEISPFLDMEPSDPKAGSTLTVHSVWLVFGQAIGYHVYTAACPFAQHN